MLIDLEDLRGVQERFGGIIATEIDAVQRDAGRRLDIQADILKAQNAIFRHGDEARSRNTGKYLFFTLRIESVSFVIAYAVEDSAVCVCRNRKLICK